MPDGVLEPEPDKEAVLEEVRVLEALGVREGEAPLERDAVAVPVPVGVAVLVLVGD